MESDYILDATWLCMAAMSPGTYDPDKLVLGTRDRMRECGSGPTGRRDPESQRGTGWVDAELGHRTCVTGKPSRTLAHMWDL